MNAGFPMDLLRPDGPAPEGFCLSEAAYQAKLDQNESPEDTPLEFKQRILQELAEKPWNRYPQPTGYLEIKTDFASAIGQPPERVVITTGGDQSILLAFWAGGGSGRRARIFEPTYPMIAAYARTTQTQVDRVNLGPDFDLTSRDLGSPVDLLILVSPNNPTGTGIERDVILKALKRRCLIFLDEAYADYAQQSMLEMAPAHPNLLIGRSLSKSLLAGVRLGYAVGHPDLIQVLERILFAPYHLNLLQLLVAKYYGLVLEKKNRC